MSRLNIIKNNLNAKEKKVSVSSSKSYSKSGAKALALTLSIITFFPGVTPYANAASVKEENFIVRKIKNAGSLAKSGYTKTADWVKKHPKIATGISTGLLLAILTAIGGVYYKSLKKNSEKAKLEEEKEKIGVDISTEVSAENLLKEEEKSEEEKSSEKVDEHKKQLLEDFKECKKSDMNSFAKDLEDLSEKMKVLVEKRRSSWVAAKDTTDEIVKCYGFIDELVSDLKNGEFKKNVSEYFDGTCAKYVDVLSNCSYESTNSKQLSARLKKYYESLIISNEAFNNYDKTIAELSEQIESQNKSDK